MGQHRLTERHARAVARIAVVCLALTVIELARAAEEGYYSRKEEGWFWKDRLPELIPEGEASVPPTLEPEPIEPPTAELLGPAPLSPAWMRESLPKYLDRALADPTPENVRAYFLLQRYAMDTAERFALAAQRVVMSDPILDENARRPISTYGGAVFDQVAQQATTELATQIAQQAGVWYFYKSDCPFCKAQNPILARLARRIGLTILPIALDAAPMPDGQFPRFVPNRGHAEQLGVEQTPTLFLVKQPNEFVVLSEGLVTEENLIHRIVAAAHEAGWITDEEYNATRPVRPSTLVVDSDGALDELALDPVRLADFLKLASP